MLTFTRRARKAIGGLENYSSIANCMDEHVEQIGNHAIGKANA